MMVPRRRGILLSAIVLTSSCAQPDPGSLLPPAEDDPDARSRLAAAVARSVPLPETFQSARVLIHEIRPLDRTTSEFGPRQRVLVRRGPYLFQRVGDRIAVRALDLPPEEPDDESERHVRPFALLLRGVLMTAEFRPLRVTFCDGTFEAWFDSGPLRKARLTADAAGRMGSALLATPEETIHVDEILTDTEGRWIGFCEQSSQGVWHWTLEYKIHGGKGRLHRATRRSDCGRYEQEALIYDYAE